MWRNEIGDLAASSPAYADGRVFVVSLEPGTAVGMRARDGKAPAAAAPGRSETSPLVYGKNVIVGSESGDVFALDQTTAACAGRSPPTATSRVAWRSTTASSTAPTTREVFAIRASNGSFVWQSSTQGLSLGRGGRCTRPRRSPFGRVYLGSIDGRVYSFDADSGGAAVGPLDRRLGLSRPRRRRHQALRADRLHRLQGPELLRAQRRDRRGALAEGHRRGGARRRQRARRGRLRRRARPRHRHLRLRRQDRQAGLRVGAGRVQPGDLRRPSDVLDRELQHPRLRARDQGGARADAERRRKRREKVEREQRQREVKQAKQRRQRAAKRAKRQSQQQRDDEGGRGPR